MPPVKRITIGLNEWQSSQLGELSEESGASQSAIVALAVSQYLRSLGLHGAALASERLEDLRSMSQPWDEAQQAASDAVATLVGAARTPQPAGTTATLLLAVEQAVRDAARELSARGVQPRDIASPLVRGAVAEDLRMRLGIAAVRDPK